MRYSPGTGVNGWLPPRVATTASEWPPPRTCSAVRPPCTYPRPFPRSRSGGCGTPVPTWFGPDRKSTRLNSSHVKISYAVFCLKKKKKHWSGYESHLKQRRDRLVLVLASRWFVQ